MKLSLYQLSFCLFVTLGSAGISGCGVSNEPIVLESAPIDVDPDKVVNKPLDQ